MSAAKRLAVARFAAGPPRFDLSIADDAVALLAADPDLAQDIEDGRALRELRAAAGATPHGIDWFYQSSGVADTDGTWARAWAWSEDGMVERFGPTIAAAADACRAALTAVTRG